MTQSDDYWQERLTEQEVEYERRLEKLREALLTALPYVEGEGTESEIAEVKAALALL